MAPGAVTFKDLGFWSLFALLLPQAVWVRKTALRFPAADGPSDGETGHGTNELKMLALGDSIIAGVGARTLGNALVGRTAQHLSDALDARVHWTAHGRSGAITRQIATRMLPRLENQPVDAVLVSAGVNDVISLHGLARWRTDIETLLRALTDRWPDAVIAFSGLPPMNHFPALPQPLRAGFGLRARQFDRVLREALNGYPQSVHIPLAFEARPGSFSDDGFHPSEQSYVEFGRLSAAAIARRLHPGGDHGDRPAPLTK